MSKLFPRTEIGGISVSRMVMGSNWLLGFSHTGAAADKMIRDRYSDIGPFKAIIESYMVYGVDTIMAPFSASPMLVRAVKETEQKLGREIIMIDTPFVNVDDNADARREAEDVFRKSRENGAKICLIHHSCAEQLVDKNKAEIRRLGDYTKMIRDFGMVPGLSAHMPELVVYSDANGYDVETYIQIYNCMGFLMQVEIETVARIIHDAKKPVITIKPMAAGRVTPFVGLNFVWNTIRECDLVTVGAYTPDEVHEDVEISFAALERRFPDIEKRSSPVMDQAAFGK
ncbi:MAG: hypothetical protein GX193_08490 [Clostridiales bacterium]|nr:hypothetical protein [Clostridiales bacterium]